MIAPRYLLDLIVIIVVERWKREESIGDRDKRCRRELCVDCLKEENYLCTRIPFLLIQTQLSSAKEKTLARLLGVARFVGVATIRHCGDF